MNVPFQRGMTFGFYSRRGVYTSAWAKEQIRKMKALNIEYVALIATVFHETDYSPREFLDITESPGELELIRMIDFIHAEGQKVMLRPMLESHDGNGRLQVWFPDDRERIPGKVSDCWKRWVASFRARNRLFAFLPCPGGKTSRTDGKQLRNTDPPAHFPLLFSKKDFWQKYAFPS